MRIAVIGSGAREHALAWRLLCGAGDVPRQDRSVIVVPGNAGIAADFVARGLAPDHARCQTPSRAGKDGIIETVRKWSADLVVVGPEQPLVDGLVDALDALGIPAFGPSAGAARLEASKAFMKQVARAAGVPTSDFVVGTTLDDVRPFIEARRSAGKGVVVKADGLCAGKGVVVCPDAHDALAEAEAFLAGRFGVASRTIVVEDMVDGLELSVFALCDGEDAVMFGAARDHKRLLDDDRGPNTGGMGAVYPLNEDDDVPAALLARVRSDFVVPTLREMRARGRPFRGILFGGLMGPLDGGGRKLQLLEYNVRFGDPEAEALLFATHIDFAPIFFDVARGEGLPKGLDLNTPQKAATVVLASAGYPEQPVAGAALRGLKDAVGLPDVHVFCAGVSSDDDGKLVVGGGRVLAVTARGDTFDAALNRAYDAVARVGFDGAQVRHDIGETVRR